MIGKILTATKGKPCSCPPGKTCTTCTAKLKKCTHVKPIVIEHSDDLPVPIKITTCKVEKPGIPSGKAEKPIKLKEKSSKEKAEKPTKLKENSSSSKVEKPVIIKEKTSNHKAEKPVIIKETTSVYKAENPVKEQVQAPQKKPSRSHVNKARPESKVRRETILSQWYKRRKASRELAKLTRLEKERLEALQLEKARRIREAEFLEELKEREKAVRHAEQELQLPPKVTLPLYNYRKEPRQTVFTEPKKTKKFKATEAKTNVASKKVYTKAQKPHKTSLNERFANFCYRICCQFYCCVTIILIIGFIFIFLV